MNNSIWIELLAIFLLILGNGFFSLAEFSVIASRRSRLRRKIEDGKSGARRALRLRESPERFLATIQVGITLVGAMVGVFSGATIVDKLAEVLAALPIEIIAETARPTAMVLVIIGVTVLSVVIGELVPKYLALAFPERYARLVSRPISAFITVTSIFSRLLSGAAALLVKLMGVKRNPDQGIVTEEEINQMIVEGKEKGVFDETEHEFVRSVFDFADSTVSRAMTPRTDVIALERSASNEDILTAIVDFGYSRYPVYEKNVDNVIGMIYTKDLLASGADIGAIDLGKILREPFFVPNTMPLSRLLREFQKGKNHLAIVLDEYGGTDGIITIEDILEELVGEIRDEYDAEAPPIVKHSESVVYADGDVWPGDVNELINSHLPEEHVDTLAGLFIDTVGHFPAKHESVDIEDARLTVLVTDRNRVLRLRVTRIEKTNGK